MSTIFANATPAIKSAVCIIRVSGPKAKDVLCSLTNRLAFEPRRTYLAKLYHPKTKLPIDQAMVIYFQAPHSFTGEDVAELHLHGSIAVIRHCLDAIASIEGCRFAEPGEFSKRAFENAKMDLTQAEGLADLIESETLQQSQSALRQMQGNLRELYEHWRSKLITLMAHVEAYIDFPDEDIPKEVGDHIIAQLLSLSTAIASHLNDKGKGQILRHGIQVAIIGAPNTGKSTLLNTLSKRNIAIVSEYAGTTRDVLEVHLDIAGFPFTLADTAGLRDDSTDVIEQEGIKRAEQRAHNADIILALFECNEQGIPILDKITQSIISHQHLVDKVLIICNKSDKMQSYVLNALSQQVPILISAKEGTGIDQLLAKLEQLAISSFSQMGDPVITRTRHRQLLLETLDHLSQCDMMMPIEILAENLRSAAVALGKITGHIDVEDVLDQLFSHFCIGK